MSDGTLLDKVGKAHYQTEQPDKLDKKQKFLLSKGTTVEDIKKYIPKLVESLRKDNPYERLEHREGKKFESPIEYAKLEGSQIILSSNPLTMAGSAQESQGSDVGSIVFNEILNHGRQTVDELVKHISGIEKELLLIVVNAMRLDFYLKDYTEKGDVLERANEKGLKTLELVDYRERRRKLKSLGHKTEGKKLEDKNTPKIHKKNNKKANTSRHKKRKENINKKLRKRIKVHDMI